MNQQPRTWEEVPGAVRRNLENPFYKKADGVPGLTHMADVLGWRAGDLNQNWGGPRPVTNLISGAAIGSLGGWGLGRLAQEVLPERFFDKDKLKRRAMMLGAAVGSAPAVWQGFDNMRQTGEASSVLDRWPQPTKEGMDLFEPIIPRDQFNAAVWSDPHTPPQLRAATAGMIEAASAIRGGSDFVSPWDLTRIAVGAGSGLVSGVIVGKALGLLAGLTPEGQRQVQNAGLWYGVLQSAVPQALGLR